MEQKYYTNERNVQILISLLKAHGIKKVIASPGTTNLTFVASLMYDGDFEIYSCIDERSAAYIACGMASESGEPVVLSCTGATASRNYMSGLTEAFYRKLPIVTITSHQGTHRIGHLIAQNIDRRIIPADISLLSVTLPVVKDGIDARFCEMEANKALLELRRNGGGPVHINLMTTYSKDYSVRTLVQAQAIHRYLYYDKLPVLSNECGRIAIFIGSHKEFTDEETLAIDSFCSTHDAVVFCDHTSGYHGAYAVHSALVFKQERVPDKIRQIGTLIHIGEVSGDGDGMPYDARRVWRVGEDGELRDTFGRLTAVFQMREIDFFRHYINKNVNHSEYLSLFKKQYQEIIDQIPELPFSNVWIAQQLHDKIPSGSQVHLGILNTLRSWNMFALSDGVTSRSNVGGFGIDGNMSSLIGASLASPEKLFFGIFGDLSFFYDMNVLGNRHVGHNLRIILVNNGKGTEFRNYDHPGAFFGEAADSFIAAAGHYGNKSKSLIKHYAKDLGFKYLSASNKQEFTDVISQFISPEMSSQSILVECFTDSKDESDALLEIRSIIKELDAPESLPPVKEILKKAVKKVIGQKGVEIIGIIRR